MIDEKKYEEKFDNLISKVNKEYIQFHMDELEKSKSEIFEDCSKIRFYKTICEYMEDVFGDFSNMNDCYGIVLAFAEEPYGLIGLLYDFYLSREHASINTYADITDIFTWYFNDVIGLPKPYDPKKGGEDDGLPI